MEPRRRNGQRQKGRPLAGIAEVWVEEGMGSGVDPNRGMAMDCCVLLITFCT